MNWVRDNMLAQHNLAMQQKSDDFNHSTTRRLSKRLLDFNRRNVQLGIRDAEHVQPQTREAEVQRYIS